MLITSPEIEYCQTSPFKERKLGAVLIEDHCGYCGIRQPILLVNNLPRKEKQVNARYWCIHCGRFLGSMWVI